MLLCSVGKNDSDRAGSPVAPTPIAGDGSGSSDPVRGSPAPSVRSRVDQSARSVVNPDASLSAFLPGSGVGARHGRAGPGGYFGNVVRLLAHHVCARLANRRECSSDCRDRSGCRSPPPCGSPRTGSVFREVPSATRANGSRRQRPLRDILRLQRCLLATGAALVLTWRLGPASRPHLPPARQLSTPSASPLPRFACQTVRSLRDHTAGCPAGGKPQNRYIHT